MRHRVVLALIAVGLIASLASAAVAQYETNNRSAIGLGLSTYRPAGSALQSLSGNWVTPTLEYHIKFDEKDRPTAAISIAMCSQSKQFAKASLLPIVASYTKYMDDSESNASWYVGGGLAAYFDSYQDLNADLGVLQKDSGTQFGVSMKAGRMLNEYWFVEARYDKVGSLSTATKGNVDFSGLTLSIGTQMLF